MSSQRQDDYEFIRFEKSKAKGKKYTAILKEKDSGRIKKIHFGQKTAQQYRDSTGLGAYTHLDHLDKERRKRYLARAKGIRDGEGNLTKDNKLSPNYYSIRFLW